MCVQLQVKRYSITVNVELDQPISMVTHRSFMLLLCGMYMQGYAEKMAGLQRIGVISETKHPSLKGHMAWVRG